ncbi:hypothetical protein LINPERHAP1_LOCUS21872, partial [Linum perenne]
ERKEYLERNRKWSKRRSTNNININIINIINIKRVECHNLQGGIRVACGVFFMFSSTNVGVTSRNAFLTLVPLLLLHIPLPVPFFFFFFFFLNLVVLLLSYVIGLI